MENILSAAEVTFWTSSAASPSSGALVDMISNFHVIPDKSIIPWIGNAYSLWCIHVTKATMPKLRTYGWDCLIYMVLIHPIMSGACQGAALATGQIEIAEAVMEHQHP